MKKLNLKILMALLNESPDRDESFCKMLLNEEHASLKFDDIGFDSLSLLNFVEDIKVNYHFVASYDEVIVAKTPNDLITLAQHN